MRRQNMNRQAITFLSLFSLILVLSVYYVMLPPVETSESEQVSETNIEETSDQLQTQLDEKRNEAVKENQEIISSSVSSSDEVSQALEEIEETKQIQTEESAVTEALKQAGYENVFVEIQNKTIKVTITKKEASSRDAAEVIKIITEKTSQKYSPEIKFVSE